MATHKNAEKKIRQIARRTDVNTARMSRVRTFVKQVEEAIKTGDKKNAQEALKVAESEMARAAQKGLLHVKTTSRKVSRLSSTVKALS